MDDDRSQSGAAAAWMSVSERFLMSETNRKALECLGWLARGRFGCSERSVSVKAMWLDLNSMLGCLGRLSRLERKAHNHLRAAEQVEWLERLK